jgi:hypothetical protein
LCAKCEIFINTLKHLLADFTQPVRRNVSLGITAMFFHDPVAVEIFPGLFRVGKTSLTQLLFLCKVLNHEKPKTLCSSVNCTSVNDLSHFIPFKQVQKKQVRRTSTHLFRFTPCDQLLPLARHGHCSGQAYAKECE